MKEANNKVNQIESVLQTKSENAEYEEIQKTVASNQTNIKKILLQCKIKIYSNLECKPKPPAEAINIIDKNGNLKKKPIMRYYMLRKHQPGNEVKPKKQTTTTIQPYRRNLVY